jgi:hypothetical protein
MAHRQEKNCAGILYRDAKKTPLSKFLRGKLSQLGIEVRVLND